MRTGALVFTLLALLAGTVRAPAWALDVRHALGTTTLAQVPERIVVLELTYAETLAALGVAPAGVADLGGYRQWVGVGADRLSGAVDVGTRQEPNLEVIASLEPDLIIGPSFRHAAIYERLSDIAPTVLFEAYPADSGGQFADMITNFREIARMVGREEKGGDVLRAMEDDLARGRETLASAGLAGAPVILAQFLPGSPRPRIFTDGSLAAGTLERLGLDNAWPGPAERFGFTTAGIEALAGIEGAHLLHIVQPGDEGFRRLSANPVWSKLDFAANGRVHALPPDTWIFGGPLSVGAMAGRVVRAMTAE